MIALETKLSDTYGDVKLVKENRKDGIESKKYSRFKINLSRFRYPSRYGSKTH